MTQEVVLPRKRLKTPLAYGTLEGQIALRSYVRVFGDKMFVEVAFIWESHGALGTFRWLEEFAPFSSMYIG